MTSARLLLISLLCFAFAAAPAGAREDYCITPGTNRIDANATRTFRQIAARPSARFMRSLQGVWFSRTVAPQTNQVSDLWERFEPGGFYQYYNRVCGGMINVCSHYQGIGLYAVRARTENAFFGLKIVSDLHRDHQCTGLAGRFVNRNTFVRPSGQIVRRVQ